MPIKIEPHIDGFPERAVIGENRVSMSVRALKPNTRYAITVDATLTDKFGQRLAAARVGEFGTGDGTPRLDIETGAWVVESARGSYAAWARNLTGLEIDVAAIPDAKVSELSRQLNWWDEEPVDLSKVGLRATHAKLPIKGKENDWTQLAIDPAQAAEGRGRDVERFLLPVA